MLRYYHISKVDVANCKVPKFYYLVAVDVRDWLSTEVGYKEAYKEKIHQKECEFINNAQNNLLDPIALQAFSADEFEIVINGSDIPMKKKTALESAYESLRVLHHLNMTDEERKHEILSNTKPAEEFLDRINKGEVIHYYFLPSDAYEMNGNMSDGLIVDLEEIEMLNVDDARMIQSPGIDYILLPTVCATERERLTNLFWLETENDFVLLVDNISSPWVEHLMQRFSYAFIRVGVNGPTKDDFSRIVKSISKEVRK